MNEVDYRNYVSLAKKELKQIEGHQIRICEYAAKVCTIRHGGISSGYYTLTDFANDIGLPRKTLSNWMLTYRNVIKKLDKPITTSREFSNAQKVEEILRRENTANNKVHGNKKIKTNYKDVEPEKIRNIYNALDIGEKPFEAEFSNIFRSIQHINSVFKKRDLNIISDESLMHVMQLLDEASDILNNHLTKKSKAKGRAA